MTNKFKNGSDAKKWKAIENTASNSFAKMMEGTAKDVDFRAVSKMLEAQSSLAATVFNEGVNAFEEMADNFIDRMNKQRTDSGKRPLTQAAQKRMYSSTYANIMKAETPDLLGTIQDIIEHRITEGFDDVSTKSQATITKGFDKLNLAAQEKELPSTDDLIALHQASTDDIGTQDDRKWPSRLKDIKQAMSESVESTLMDVVNRIRGNPPGTAAPSVGYSPVNKAAETATTWELVDPNDPSGTGSTSNSSTALATLSPKTESAVVDAAHSQSKFHDMVSDFLDNFRRNNSDSEQEEKEEKKKDSWLRGIGSWLKEKMPSSKSKSKFMSILKNVGKAFLLALTAPELLETIAAKAKEYLTMENIGKFMKATWDTVYDTGKDIVTWILDKLNKGPGSDPLHKTYGERYQARIDEFNDRLGKAQTHLKSANGDTSKLSAQEQIDLKSIPNLLVQLKKAQADEAAKHPETGSAGAPASPGMLPGGGQANLTTPAKDAQPVTNGGGYRYDAQTGKILKLDDKATQPTGATTSINALNNTKASTTINANLNTGTTTTIAPAKPVTIDKPVTVDDPNQTAMETEISRRKANLEKLGVTSAVTLGSIPTHAGVDDTLHLMNVGGLS